MIIENELSANHIYSKNSLTSIVLRVIIMLTTAALLAAVIKFHVHEVQVRLYMKTTFNFISFSYL